MEDALVPTSVIHPAPLSNASRDSEYHLWKIHIRKSMFRYLKRHHEISRKMVKVMSHQPNLDLEFVLLFYYLPWDTFALSHHPDMTPRFLYRLRRELCIKKWKYPSSFPYSCFPSTPFELHKVWSLKWLEHGSSTMIKKKQLWRDPRFPLAIVIRYPHVRQQVDWTFLCTYRAWTIPELYRLLPHYKMSFKMLSKNYFLTPNMVHEFLGKAWDWKSLATHPAFPPQLIWEDKILFPRWSWKHAIRHPRMTLAFWSMIRHQWGEPFYSSILFINPFQYCPELRMYAFLKILRFVDQRLQRRQILGKVHWLHHLSHALPQEVCHVILSFV